MKVFLLQSIDVSLISDVQLKINEKSSMCFTLSNPSSPASYILQNKQKLQLRFISVCPHKLQLEVQREFWTSIQLMYRNFSDTES